MSKIKLNLDSGSVLEKKLINAFQTPEGKYVIFDDENVGSMGLPIILVSKVMDNKLLKIEDQGEWQLVKEHLKNVIAGNEMQFVTIPLELPAADIYFTQLTLPVQSFDALKTNYKVDVAPVQESVVPTPEVTPTGEPMVAPVPEAIPAVEPAPMPEPVPTVEPSPIPEPMQTVESVPAVDVAPAPLPGIPNVADMSVTEPSPIPESVVAPEVNFGPTIAEDGTDPYKEMKESFLQACENVFDAMVVKLEKKE